MSEINVLVSSRSDDRRRAALAAAHRDVGESLDAVANAGTAAAQPQDVAGDPIMYRILKRRAPQILSPMSAGGALMPPGRDPAAPGKQTYRPAQ